YRSFDLYGPIRSLFASGGQAAPCEYYLLISAQSLGQSGTFTLICSSGTTGGTNNYVLTLAKIVGDNPADEDAATLIAGEVHAARSEERRVGEYRLSGMRGEGGAERLKA